MKNNLFIRVMICLLGIVFVLSSSISIAETDGEQSYTRDPLSGDKYPTPPPELLSECKSPKEIQDLLQKWAEADPQLKDDCRKYLQSKKELNDLEQKLKVATEKRDELKLIYKKDLLRLKKRIIAATNRLFIQSSIALIDVTTDFMIMMNQAKQAYARDVNEIKHGVQHQSRLAQERARQLAEQQKLIDKAAAGRKLLNEAYEQLKKFNAEMAKYEAEKKLKSTPSPPAPPPPKVYKTKSMGPFFITYDKDQGVKYYTLQEREQFRVQVRDGKLFDAKGNPMDTSQSLSSHRGKGYGIYVIDEKGNYYVHANPEMGKTHHSSLLAGGDVAGAGEIKIEDGRLLYIDRNSGHYNPDSEMFKQSVQQLKDMGADTGGAIINDSFR
jgi:hypothetical protein